MKKPSKMPLLCVNHPTGHNMLFSGASAIACGIAEALKENSTTVSIVKACIYGARKGEEIGNETARKAEGKRVIRQIEESVKEAILAENMIDAENIIDETIGADGSVQTSVALCIGLFLAADGDFCDTLLSCANIGGDADTNACIAGMLVGAYNGYSKIPEEWINQFKDTNKTIDLEKVAKELTEICIKNC